MLKHLFVGLTMTVGGLFALVFIEVTKLSVRELAYIYLITFGFFVFLMIVGLTQDAAVRSVRSGRRNDSVTPMPTRKPSH